MLVAGAAGAYYGNGRRTDPDAMAKVVAGAAIGGVIGFFPPAATFLSMVGVGVFGGAAGGFAGQIKWGKSIGQQTIAVGPIVMGGLIGFIGGSFGGIAVAGELSVAIGEVTAALTVAFIDLMYQNATNPPEKKGTKLFPEPILDVCTQDNRRK